MTGTGPAVGDVLGTPGEAKAVRSFSSGDEMGLFQAMQEIREEKRAD